jgi:hypothetical protein
VEHDAIVLPTLMLGLPGLVVLGAAEYGGELELLVEPDEAVASCPDCGCGQVSRSVRRCELRLQDEPPLVQQVVEGHSQGGLWQPSRLQAIQQPGTPPIRPTRYDFEIPAIAGRQSRR